MKILKSIAVAFSLYSAIPMPTFEWTEEDMKHNLIFLPWIGAVTGGILWCVFRFLMSHIPQICTVAAVMFVPLAVTGGFHVDGYMDVQDALRSYKSKEEKLEILKDPHIGAFSVIRLAMTGIIWLFSIGAVVYTSNLKIAALVCCTFAMSRCMSALLSLKLKRAKDTGMLSMETKNAKGADFAVITAESILTGIIMLIIFPLGAVLALAALAVFSIYYKYMCTKQFGGVTGDTAGYYTVMSETVMILITGIMSLVL